MRSVCFCVLSGMLMMLLIGCGGGGSTPGPTLVAVSGLVLDSSTLTGVAGATVELTSTGGRATSRAAQWLATTDATGYYEMIDVAPGHATMKIAMPENSPYDSIEVALYVSADRPSSSVTVKLNPKGIAVTEIAINPKTPAGLQVGATQQFTAIIATNPPIPLSATFTVTGNIGTIDANGLFTATRPGTGTVTATSRDKSDSAVVTVSPNPTNSRIDVSPRSSFIPANSAVQFEARIYSGDDLVDLPVEWRVDGYNGIINASGVFTGEKAGECRVIASINTQTGTLEGSAAVTVGQATAPWVTAALSYPCPTSGLPTPVAYSVSISEGAPETVWMEVTTPNATIEQVPLQNDGAGKYVATWMAPLNTNADGRADVYTLKAFARFPGGALKISSQNIVTIPGGYQGPADPPSPSEAFFLRERHDETKR
ncbi:MAG: Bacterial Ig-like domain (group 2) [bacterium ADurb.Bin429]|nr:MAG: Bacterial Ig-like domain (group 2) [bacterium ADurb.Bin429]